MSQNPSHWDGGPDPAVRREKLDRLSRQLRIDQTARAVFAALTRENTITSAAPSIARVAYDRAEILEAERERRQKKDTESS